MQNGFFFFFNQQKLAHLMNKMSVITSHGALFKKKKSLFFLKHAFEFAVNNIQISVVITVDSL